jgi:hypothetical protein
VRRQTLLAVYIKRTLKFNQTIHRKNEKTACPQYVGGLFCKLINEWPTTPNN